MRPAIATVLIVATSLLPGQEKKPAVLTQRNRAGDPANQVGLFGKRSGGSPTDSAAIKNGLLWLARNQHRNGHWQCDHSKDASVAITSLAVLAMLGDGSTMRVGPHKTQIKRGVAWLRKRQKERGAFADATGPHLLATLAMTETYHLSNYKLLKQCASKGINHAASLRSPDGGWLASPDNEVSAPSLTVWGTTLLATAAETDVGNKNLACEGILEWLGSRQANLAPRSGVLGADVPMIRQGELGYDQSAANAFTLCWLARTDSSATKLADATAITKAALTRVRELPRVWEKNPKHKLSINEWYCSSYALAQAGDTKAVEKITKALAAKQLADGDDQGSWHPIGVWGKAGGRAWTTAMAVLTLEAPHRYAKIVGR